MKTVMTSGTLSDRVAALTVTVQNSPVHNLPALDSLVTMTTKKGRREAMLALGAVHFLPLNLLHTRMQFEMAAVGVSWQDSSVAQVTQ